MLVPNTHRITLEDFALDVDIGFHDFEVGAPQRVLVCVDITLDTAHFPHEDTREAAWDYDVIRETVFGLVRGRRFNLQETLARELFAALAVMPGVIGLKVRLRKPDVYPDCGAVGVALAGGVTG